VVIKINLHVNIGYVNEIETKDKMWFHAIMLSLARNTYFFKTPELFHILYGLEILTLKETRTQVISLNFYCENATQQSYIKIKYWCSFAISEYI